MYGVHPRVQVILYISELINKYSENICNLNVTITIDLAVSLRSFEASFSLLMPSDPRELFRQPMEMLRNSPF